MRPVSDKNTTLRAPLNDILGYEANVRLLRCLVHSGYPMSNSELAHRTGLSLPGVHKAVPRLMKTGIIHHIGSGKQQQVALRMEHPFSESVIRLFKSEERYYESLLSDLKEQIKGLDKKPKSVWIFGKVAEGVDEYGDAIQLAILGDLKTIDNQVAQLKDQLYHSGFEADYDVTLEVQGVTKADLQSRFDMMDEIILLWGLDPRDLMEKSTNPKDEQKLHEAFDLQSLKDAKVWSELLKIYPEIIQRTINYLEDQISQIKSGEKKELQEWKHILESMSYQRLKKFLESDSERSTRLRQSLPFWQVLTDDERENLKKIKSNREGDE